jgi:hypothetical protein
MSSDIPYIVEVHGHQLIGETWRLVVVVKRNAGAAYVEVARNNLDYRPSRKKLRGFVEREVGINQLAPLHNRIVDAIWEVCDKHIQGIADGTIQP